jgi:hypothetical protein
MRFDLILPVVEDRVEVVRASSGQQTNGCNEACDTPGLDGTL